MAKHNSIPGTRLPRSGLPALFAATLALAACGGGGGDPAPAPTPPQQQTPPPPPPPPPVGATVLQGIVASGAAIAGATITISDVDAATANVSTTSGSGGAYSADVTTLRAPLLVSASGTLNGEAITLAAVVPTVTASSSNTANVTPLTNAVAALVAPAGNVGALATPATLASSVTAATAGNASALVVNTLRTDPATNTALGAGFHPLTTTFSANGTGIDRVLDNFEVTTSASGVSITNLAAPSTAGTAATVTLTPAQTATPTVVPTIAATSSSTLPTAAEMLALATKLNACLAQPTSSRVTTDGAGTVTAVSSACNFAPATWRTSGGLDWPRSQGQFFFSLDSVTGAVVGVPTIAAVLEASNHSGTTFQHPVCNTSACVVMRVPVISASGRPFIANYQVGRLNGQWDFVGNQLPYSIAFDHRLHRMTQVNRAIAANSYFSGDRFEARIRLSFDPSVGNTSHVRSVRFKGPGLPSAGVVSTRSLQCGTEYRFAIVNQQGSQNVAGSTTVQVLTGGAGTDFVFSAARHDGSALAMPVPTLNWATSSQQSNQSFSPAPVTQNIPAWSEYTAEIFHYGNATDVPNEIVRVLNNSPYEPASVGASIAWPTLSQASVDRYLTPTGAASGPLTSLAQNLTWTNPAGRYVSSGYLFSQNQLTLTNSESETAGYWQRGVINFRPEVYGDSQMGAKDWSGFRSSTSLSPSAANVNIGPNPRCTGNELVALEGVNTNSSYREVGLFFRGTGNKLYNDLTYWSN